MELTAWEGSLARNWTGLGEFREVIQIGAVRLDAASLEELASLSILTQPRRNPILSDYIVALTGISNEDMARNGVAFADGFSTFVDFCGSAEPFAYGGDAAILNENLDLHGLSTELPPCKGHDITPWLRDAGLELRGINSGKLASFVGAKWCGQEHNGLDDARSIAAAVRKLVSQDMTNPFLRD